MRFRRGKGDRSFIVTFGTRMMLTTAETEDAARQQVQEAYAERARKVYPDEIQVRLATLADRDLIWAYGIDVGSEAARDKWIRGLR